jgi:TP901 family phage tail tape measure protein
MAENVSLGANFQQILTEQLKVVKGFGAIEDAMIKTAKVGAGFKLGKDGLGKDLNNAKANLVLVNKQGAELSTTFEKVGNDWRVVNSAVKQTSKSLQATAKATERADREAKKLAQSIQNAKVKQLTKEIKDAEKALARSRKEAEKIRITKIKDDARAVSVELKKVTAEMRKLKSSSEQSLFTFRDLARLQISNTASRVIGDITSSLQDAISTSREFTQSIAQISTIDISGTSISEITDDILKLSNESGLDVLDVATAQYQALSNQVVNAGNAFQFMSDSNKLAVATLSTSAQAVNILSSTINAFGLTSQSSTEISDSFFKTLELGRLRLGEISDTFGRIAVIANQLGVSLNETQATLALFTRQGIKASQASTLMRSIMLKLIKPTEDMKDFLAQLGFESGEAAIKTLGFGKVMGLIEQEAVRSGNALGDLGEKFSRVRAITGAAIFSGSGLDEFNRDLQEISNSTGAVEKAFQTIEDSAGKTVDKGLNKLKNALTSDIGNAINQMIVNVDEAINLFDLLEGSIKLVANNIGLLATIIGGIVIAKFKLSIAASAAAAVAVEAHNKALIANTAASAANATAQQVNAAATATNAAAHAAAGASAAKNVTVFGTAARGLARLGPALISPWGLATGAVIATGAAIAYFANSAERDLEKVSEAAEKTADRLKDVIEKEAQQAARQISQRDSALTQSIDSALKDQAAEITEKVLELNQGQKELIDTFLTIEQGQEAFVDRALESFDSKIDTAKKGLADLNSELKRVTKGFETSQKTISDTILEKALNLEVTAQGRRDIISDEIGAEQARGPQADPKEEEARLKRIIELTRQLSGLANTRGRRDEAFDQIIQAEQALQDFFKSRQGEVSGAIEVQEAEIKTLELDKQKLKNSQEIVEAKIKELEALRSQANTLEEQKALLQEIQELSDRRAQLIQKTGIDTSAASLGGGRSELSEGVVEKLEELEKSSKTLDNARNIELFFMKVNTAKLVKLAEEQGKLLAIQSASRAASDQAQQLQKLGQQIQVGLTNLNEARRAAGSTIQALVPEPLRPIADFDQGGEFAEQPTQADFEAFEAEVAEANALRARLNTGLARLATLQGAIQRGDEEGIKRALKFSDDLAKLAEVITKERGDRQFTKEQTSELDAFVKAATSFEATATRALKQIASQENQKRLEDTLARLTNAFATGGKASTEAQAATSDADLELLKAKRDIKVIESSEKKADEALKKVEESLKPSLDESASIQKSINNNILEQTQKSISGFSMVSTSIAKLNSTLSSQGAGISVGDINVTIENGGGLDPRAVGQEVAGQLKRLQRTGVLS